MNDDVFTIGEGVLVGAGVVTTVCFAASGEAEDAACISAVGVPPTGIAVSRIESVLLEQEVNNTVKTNETAIISKIIALIRLCTIEGLFSSFPEYLNHTHSPL